MTKKRIALALFAALLALAPAALFAIPGIVDYLPTRSGSYVYYRDYTYEDETYIGFLFYDQNTYALRYLSPNAKRGAKSIMLYVTVNPEKGGVELTGERIVGDIKPEDVETLNYLHDLLYELSARRKAQNGKNLSAGTTSTEEFIQFGGEAKLSYNAFVPFFNLRSIAKTDGTPLFTLAYIGELGDSADTAFGDFAGVPSVKMPEKSKTKFSNWTKKTKRTLGGFSIKLDKNWNELADGVWARNETIVFATPVQFDKAELAQKDFVISMLLCAQPDVFPLFDHLEITDKGGETRLSVPSYSRETGRIVRNVTRFVNVSPTEMVMVNLTVDESLYLANTKYFDAIIDSAAYGKGR